MQSQEPAKCLECGRTPTFGAVYCPYCGTPLPARSAQAGLPAPGAPPRQALAPPERDSLSGPCAILFSGQGQLDVRRAGKIVADALRRPLSDVTREMKISKGILAQNIDADTARDLAAELELADVTLLLIPDAALRDLPPFMRMKSARFSAAGLLCEAYQWDATQELKVPWQDILLISCARLLMKHVSQPEPESLSPEEEKRQRLFKVLPFGKANPKLTTETWHEFILDVYCRQPRVRLRLDENPAAYAFVEVESFGEDKAAFYREARHILRHAPNAALNDGIRLLAHNAPEVLWEALTFEDKRDFDLYNMWLLQLVRYGLPIPQESE